MKLVRQPKGTALCGQACVATICGLSLEKAIMLCGTDGPTTFGHLKVALACVGIESKRRRGYDWEEGTAILRYTHPSGKAHWVVWDHCKWYDPASGVHREKPKWLAGSTVKSYLEILE